MRFFVRLFPLLFLVAICPAQDTNFATGPQYLITGQSTMFLHSIETPSLSFGPGSAPAPAITTETVPASQVVETPPQVSGNVDFTQIFWGERSAASQATREIEISGSQPPPNLPKDFVDIGVTAMVNAQTLQEGGVSLGETAAYWKAHGSHPTHTYTNKDVERAPGS